MNNYSTESNLKHLIENYFDLGGIRELCFELGIEYENLENPKRTLKGASIALVKIAYQNSRLEKLIELCRQKRPHLIWPDAATVLSDPLIRVTTSVTNYWLVPFTHNLNFVGREQELEDIYHLLNIEYHEKPIGISGLGGVGKTQLAIQYAYKHRRIYPDGIFYISNSKSVTQQFSDYSLIIGVSSHDDLLEKRAASFWKYLVENPRTLLIFDDLQDFSSLTVPFLPGVVLETVPGHLIFTTRKRKFDAIYVEKALDVFSKQEALELLSVKSGRHQILDNSEDYLFSRLCELLGYLPLALDIAGSFLSENPEITIEGYINRLLSFGALHTIDSSALDLNVSPTRHSTVVTSTLDSSWDLVKNKNARLLVFVIAQLPSVESVALSTLSLMSGLSLSSPEGFPSPLLKALRMLVSLSLAEKIADDFVHVHPLIFEYFQTLQLDEMYTDQSSFRAQIIKNVQDTLGSLGNLEEYVIHNGIDIAVKDFQLVHHLIGSGQNPLLEIEKIVNHEAHHLRSWDSDKQPSFFAERIHSRAIRLNNESMREDAEALLRHHMLPYLKLMWRSGSYEKHLIRTLSGHLDEVCSVIATHDERKIISGSGSLDSSGYSIALGGTGETHQYAIKVWDSATGNEILTFEGEDAHNERIYKLAITSDDTRFISASADNTLKVWDLESGKLLHTLEGHLDRVEAVVTYKNGQRAISGGWDETIKVWDLVRGEEITTLPGHTSEREHFENYVLSLLVIESKNLLISGSRDSTIKIWDLTTFEELTQLDGHLQSVYSLEYIPKTNTLISGSTSIDALIEWNLDTWEPIRSIRLGNGRPAKDIRWLDGSDIILIGSGRNLITWNMVNDSISIIGSHEKEIKSIDYLPQSGVAVTASADHTIKMWDINDFFQDANYGYIGQQHENKIRFLELASNGKFLVSGSTHVTKDEVIIKKRINELQDKLPDEEGNGQDIESIKGMRDSIGMPYDISMVFHKVDSGIPEKTKTFRWSSDIEFTLLRSLNYPSITFHPNETKLIVVPQEQDLFITNEILFHSDHESQESIYSQKLLVPFPYFPTKGSFIADELNGGQSSSLIELILSIKNGSYEWLLSIYKDRYRQPIIPIHGRDQIVTLQLIPIDNFRKAYAFVVSDFETGEHVQVLLCSPSTFHSKLEATIVSPGGKYFVAFYMDNQFELWDLETGEKKFHVNIGHPEMTGEIVEILFSTDQTRLIVRYEIGIFLYIKLDERKVEFGGANSKTVDSFFGGKIEFALSRYAFLPDGKRFVDLLGETHNIIRVGQLKTFNEWPDDYDFLQDENEIASFIGDTGFTTLLPLEIDQRTVIYAGDESGTVWAFELVDDK